MPKPKDTRSECQRCVSSFLTNVQRYISEKNSTINCVQDLYVYTQSYAFALWSFAGESVWYIQWPTSPLSNTPSLSLLAVKRAVYLRHMSHHQFCNCAYNIQPKTAYFSANNTNSLSGYLFYATVSTRCCNLSCDASVICRYVIKITTINVNYSAFPLFEYTGL